MHSPSSETTLIGSEVRVVVSTSVWRLLSFTNMNPAKQPSKKVGDRVARLLHEEQGIRCVDNRPPIFRLRELWTCPKKTNIIVFFATAA